MHSLLTAIFCVMQGPPQAKEDMVNYTWSGSSFKGLRGLLLDAPLKSRLNGVKPLLHTLLFEGGL